MDLLLEPVQLHGAVTPPPSKSEAQRLILAAALAEGTSRLKLGALSDDLRAALRGAEALGARREETEPGTLLITGAGAAKRPEETLLLNCGESGAALRLMLPLASVLFGSGVFTGEGRLLRRPLRPYLALLEEKGLSFSLSADVLTVQGRLRPGDYRLPGDVSSQFFSGLLFALPLLDGPSRLIPLTPLVSADYLRLTISVLARAGIELRTEDGAYLVQPGRYRPLCAEPEADWSQAAFWIAAERLGAKLRIEGLNGDSLQADRRMPALADRLRAEGEITLDLSQNPDLLPPLALLAALRKGTCRLTGVARLRGKESDRPAAVASVLEALGVSCRTFPDALEITGAASLRGGAELDCAGDHRIAMMCADAAARCERPVILRGADCVKKSYPDFWDVYQSLGGKIDVVKLG